MLSKTGSTSGTLPSASTGSGKASDDQTILDLFEELALEAGRHIMAIYDAGVAFETKADASPVTEADRAAERVILRGLRETLVGVPCVAEEEVAAGVVPVLDDGDAFLLIDPLDGTKEFIRRGSDFTVNIALVRNGIPEIGVVYAPAQDVLYAGRPGAASEVQVSDFQPTSRRAIAVTPPSEPLKIVASRSHRTPETDEFIAKYGSAEIVSIGSSLKFCLVASGKADLYPRFGRTMEWDTAAGDAVLRAAGGRTRLVDGGSLLYGKRNQPDEADFANPWFIADSGAVD